jgi:hypothetical protein
MKKFLLNISLYLLIVLALILASIQIIFTIKKQNGFDFNFVSNSLSHNLKAGFILKNQTKFLQSKIIIIGSSMSLNNLNAQMIEDSLHYSTFNLASWGMKMPFFKDYDIWRNHKILLANIQFDDLGDPMIETKAGFPFTENRAFLTYNVFFDHKTYLSQLEEGKKISSTNAINTYYNCHFDACGSALLNDTGFVINSERWKEDGYKIVKADTNKINVFISKLKSMIFQQQMNSTLIFCFSPGRKYLYNKSRAILVDFLSQKLNKEIPAIVFINKYNDSYPDSWYVDDCHFNLPGANFYTSEIIKAINSKGLLH